MEIINSLLQPALEVALQVLLPVVLSFVAAWLNSLRVRLNREIEERELEILRALAVSFVKAAEQAGLIGEIQDVGEAKKQMVIDLLQAEVDSRGLNISVDRLSAIVEAAVVEVFGFSEPSGDFTEG